MDTPKIAWTISDGDYLKLNEDYCSCGNPDPLMEDHTENCPMSKVELWAEEIAKVFE